MSKNDDLDLPDGELTAQERQHVRRLLRDEVRMTWLWSTLRIWVGYLVAISASIYATYEVAIKYIKVTFR